MFIKYIDSANYTKLTRISQKKQSYSILQPSDTSICFILAQSIKLVEKVQGLTGSHII